MIIKRYVTLEVDIEMPDFEDSRDIDYVVDSLMEEAMFDFSYDDDGDGLRVVDVTLHSYTDEEPE